MEDNGRFAPGEEIPWEGRAADAVWRFARECAELVKNSPNKPEALDWIMNTLMTELWDNAFSQTEIRTAFEKAVAAMPRYAIGEERRPNCTGPAG